MENDYKRLLAAYNALKRENARLKRENAKLKEKLSYVVENLPNEEWRDIGGYEGLYQISNYGRVKSFARGTVIVRIPAISGDGYLYISTSKNGVHKNLKIHRLVAQAFVPNPEALPCVNHIDGNKLNNLPANLEWCTVAENNRHAIAAGLNVRANRKLTPDAIRYIRENPERFTYKQLGEMFEVSPNLILGIRKNRFYKDVE